MRRKMAAGNWKMNGLRASLAELGLLASKHPAPVCEVLICPPATLLGWASEALLQSEIRLGGQDCHSEKSGAHTGDVSAAMLADAGASHVILGHSERRADHGESSDMVAAKARTAHMAGLTAVICVGETEAERDAGTPTLTQIAEVHDFLRAELSGRHGAEAEAFRLLYGGSVKPSNAAEIFAVSNVDGALVGGASLKASDFGAIIDALDAA